MVKSFDDFSLGMFYYQLNSCSGNMAVSPLGAFFVVQMLNEGTPLECHEHKSVDRRELEALRAELDKLSSLVMAQRLFVRRRADLLASWVSRSEKFIPSLVVEAPILSDPTTAVEQVNVLFKELTHGFYDPIISAMPPDVNTFMVTTLKYHGQLITPFRMVDTKPEDFYYWHYINVPYVVDGKASLRVAKAMKVAMMRVVLSSTNVLETHNNVEVTMPYCDGVEIVLLLPAEGSTPDNLFYPFNRTDSTEDAPPEPIVVELPRFEIRDPAIHSNDGLARIEQGFNEALLDEQAQDREITDVDVIHRAAIRVDEVDFAAAELARSSFSSPSPARRIRFDRPFGFCLRLATSRAILMLGRVDLPLEWTGR